MQGIHTLILVSKLRVSRHYATFHSLRRLRSCGDDYAGVLHLYTTVCGMEQQASAECTSIVSWSRSCIAAE